MVALLKLVLRITSPLQDRRVDGAQHKVVLRARKVQQAQTVDVALVLGWQRHAVDG